MTSPTWSVPSWSRPASTWPSPTTSSDRPCSRSTPPTRRPSSGTSTPRAGAAAHPSATTSAASTPSSHRGWATCPAGSRRASGSTRTTSSTSSARRSSAGEFDSLEERNEIYRTMTQAGLDESIRIWLATVNNSFPARADARGRDPRPVSGPRNPWTLREAYVPGSDDVRVGHQWVWTERTTYNPVGGFGDVYSVRPVAQPRRPGHPERPLHAASRSPSGPATTVETAGPNETLEVPADALELGRRVQDLGPGRGRHDRGQQGHLRLLRLHRLRSGITASPSPWPTRCTPSPSPSTSPTTPRRRASRPPSR